MKEKIGSNYFAMTSIVIPLVLILCFIARMLQETSLISDATFWLRVSIMITIFSTMISITAWRVVKK